VVDAPLVLVVEDDSVLATVLSTLLSGDGLRVERVSTVADARAWLFARRPDVLVLDLDLPDGSGLEVVAVLEATAHPDGDGGTRTSVVVYTGTDVDPELGERLEGVGAVVLSKGSTHPEEFEARVLRLVDSLATSGGAR
jgi:CheY-like chemotaxis protein